MAHSTQARIIPKVVSTPTEGFRRIGEAVESLYNGKSHNIGEVTLTGDQTSTVVNDLRIGPNTVIVFMPLTANAAAQIATMYVSSRGKQTFTITHTATEQEDMSFEYICVGG